MRELSLIFTLALVVTAALICGLPLAIASQAHAGTMESRQIDAAVGQAVYEKTCSLCHATGLAGAPKFGDKEAWAPHIREGLDHLAQIAINGEGAMPPRGGNPALTDEEIRAAVSYMMENSR